MFLAFVERCEALRFLGITGSSSSKIGTTTKTYIGVNILANFSGLIPGSYPGSYSCGSFTGSFSIISDADNKRGKVVYDGRNLYYGSEFLSVKGFYNGVTNFTPMESDALKIPSNLADLPTSKYNIFCNRIL